MAAVVVVAASVVVLELGPGSTAVVVVGGAVVVSVDDVATELDDDVSPPATGSEVEHELANNAKTATNTQIGFPTNALP